MSIITQADIEGRIGESELIRLTDDAVAGTVDTTVVAAAIADGEGEVLGRLAQAYTIPLDLADTNTAAMVKTALLDVVLYRLMLRRPPVIEDYSNGYKNAIAWAEKIAAGSLGLPGESPVGEAPAGGGRIAIDASERIFSRESFEGL